MAARDVVTAWRRWKALERTASTPGPRYCSRCGAANDPNASYCFVCKATLSP